MLTKTEKEKIAFLYYRNNAKKLRSEVIRVLNYIHCTESDTEELVDVSNVVFAQALRNYDEIYDLDKFNGFLFCCLQNKLKSELTRMNRTKRLSDKNSISLETTIGNSDNDITLGEVLRDDFNVETEALGEDMSKVNAYMARISPRQREIVTMLMQGYSFEDIRNILHLSTEQMKKHLDIIRNYKNVSVLY